MSQRPAVGKKVEPLRRFGRAEFLCFLVPDSRRGGVRSHPVHAEFLQYDRIMDRTKGQRRTRVTRVTRLGRSPQ